jgi:hypothetical protein
MLGLLSDVATDGLWRLAQYAKKRAAHAAAVGKACLSRNDVDRMS